MFNCVKMANMKVPRHGHAACSFMGKYIIVSGTRKEVDSSPCSVELFDTEVDSWLDLPMMKEGRHYHASCEFSSEWLYVFAGISNIQKRYSSSIERLNVKQFLGNSNSSWNMVNVVNEANVAAPIAPRQGLGAAQLDTETILIMGGFGGKYFNESLALSIETGVCRKTAIQMPTSCFPFAVPTVSDCENGQVYTVDWESQKVFRYKAENWNMLINLK